MSLIIDTETIPQDHKTLIAKMPEDLRNAVMPLELREPEEPNFPDQCPAYSLPEAVKKLADAREVFDSLKDVPGAKGFDKAKVNLESAQLRVEDAENKRKAWIAERREKWQGKLNADRQKWELAIQEGKARFIEEAALNANLGHAKLIGLRNTLTKLTRIFIWEPEQAICGTIQKWFKSLPPIAEDAKARVFREGSLTLEFFSTERGMLKAFFRVLSEEMDPTGEGLSAFDAHTQANRPDIVTYYGNQFDFPFLFKRAWITGHPQPSRQHRRGRFFNDRFIDLHEEWTFGDRQERSGGLDGLAQALGYDGAKTQDGQAFHKWYSKDPVEGVVYLFNDLDMTEFCGRKMAVVPDEKKD